MQQIERTKNPWTRLRLWLAEHPGLSLGLCLAVCLCSAPVFQIMVEYVRIQQEVGTLRYVAAHLAPLLAGSVVLILAQLVLLFLTRRPAVAVGVEGVVALAFAAANYFKMLYREEPLLPADLAVAQDGLAVGKELNLTPTKEMVIFAVLLAAAVLLLTRVRLPLPAGRRGLAVRLGGGVASLALLAVYMPAVIWSPARMNPLGVEIFGEKLSASYNNGTFVTSFLYLTGNSTQHPPEGYDRETVEKLAEQVAAAYTGTDGSQPDILVVMAESFFDLEQVIPAEYSVDLMENFDRLAAEGISGYFLSEGYGGGTANVEFSVLSGYYTGYLPYGMTAYTGCVDEDFACYPRWLREQGYATGALHLNSAGFYNRNIAYPNMGFDSFWSIEDCENPKMMGAYFDGFASDESTVDELIRRYEELSAGDAPVFLHTVTIQNHLPYMTDSYDDEYRVKADCPGLTEDERLILETVATNLRDMDQQLGRLTDYLETVDRDVILLFFGDHQTAVYGYMGEDVNSKAASYLSLPEPEQTVEKYKAPFLIWSNFQKEEGETTPLASAEMLLPLASQWFDLPLPPWMEWLADNLDTCRGIARGKALDPQGTLQEPAEPYTDFLRPYELLQYDMLFGKQWSREQLFGA